MFKKLLLIVGLAVLLPLSIAYVSTAHAAQGPKPPTPKPDPGKVGYGTAVIQMMPLMVPYRLSSGVRYQLVTPRVYLAPGETERAACYMIPIIHEKMLLYMYNAKLQPADFEGQRKEVLEKKLLDIAIATTDRSFYTGARLVEANTPPLEIGANTIVADSADKLEPRSLTLSAQCK